MPVFGLPTRWFGRGPVLELRHFARAVAGAAVLASAFALSTPALAQEGYAANGDADFGKSVWLSRSSCPECHGLFADGDQEVDQQPRGADLRVTTLTPLDMFGVIKCGRPGTQMPYFFRNAWRAPRTCFGMTEEDVGDLIPDAGAAMLPDRLINALVAFIYRDFVGAGPVTFEHCREMLGETASRCPSYPLAADLD